MMRRILLFVLIVLSVDSSAQDIVFSQFYNNKLFTNPAFAGEGNGLLFNIATRNQWRSSVPSTKVLGNFSYSAASIDLQFCSLPNDGFSLLISNDMQGSGGLTTNQFSLLYSHKFELKKRSYIRMGIQYDFANKRIDQEKLIFSDQIDPFSNSTTTKSSFPFDNLNVSYNNFNTGFIARLHKKVLKRYFQSTTIGVAIHNFFEPNSGFIGTNSLIKRRYTAHLSAEPVNKKTFTLEPSIRIMSQNNALSYEGIINTSPHLDKKDYGIFFGGGFRNLNMPITNTSTLLFDFGMNWYSMNAIHRIILNYDVNVGGVSAGNFRIWEISYSVSLRNKCNKLPPSQIGQYMRCAGVQ